MLCCIQDALKITHNIHKRETFIFLDMELRQFEMYFLTTTTALIICIIIRNLASSSSRRERRRGTRGEGGKQPYGIIYNYTF